MPIRALRQRLSRLRRRAALGARAPLRGALQRVSDGTVMVSEYPLHPRPRWGWGEPPHAALGALLAEGAARHAALLARTAAHAGWLRTIPRRAPAGELCFDNEWWGGLDAAVQCTLLIERDPATYLEVGSGYSTMFARRAITDHRLRTRIVSIDPSPRAAVDRLCDEVVRAPFEATDLRRFGDLAADDLVLFDGSHTAFMGSDATAFVLDALPLVPRGVAVGIDDVFLPWDYHPTWADRWYGEQYLLAAWLLGGHRGWEVLLPGWDVTSSGRCDELLEPLWPVVEPAGGRVALSFWLDRR